MLALIARLHIGSGESLGGTATHKGHLDVFLRQGNLTVGPVDVNRVATDACRDLL